MQIYVINYAFNAKLELNFATINIGFELLQT